MTSFGDDGEILDGIVKRSRGEIRRMCSLKVTSCTTIPTPLPSTCYAFVKFIKGEGFVTTSFTNDNTKFYMFISNY